MEDKYKKKENESIFQIGDLEWDNEQIEEVNFRSSKKWVHFTFGKQIHKRIQKSHLDIH